jgi:hypothetical protein
VSVKLTPDICINKASSNSRLTAVGRWATASDRHSQNCQTLFSFFLWLDNNWTTPAWWKTYWNCIAFELGTHCCFFYFVLFLWFFFSTLVRKWQNYFWDTISRIGGGGTNTKIIKTETLLHLNLEIFFLFFYFIYLFIYSFTYLFFIYSFFNPLLSL